MNHKNNMNYSQKNEQELQAHTNNKTIQPGYRNGIWYWKMYHASDEKWKKKNIEKNRIYKPRKNLNAWRKNNYNYMKILEADNIKHAEMKEKKENDTSDDRENILKPSSAA